MIIDMSGYGIFIFAFALIGGWLYIKNDMLKIRNKTNETIKTALGELNIISDDKRFDGSRSRMILSNPSVITASSTNKYKIEQLCKSDNGQWFVFCFATWNGAALPESFSVVALSETDARRYLAKDADLYVTEFGEPEAA